MILYWLINFLFTLLTMLFSLFPVIETPLWLVSNLPQIFTMIFAFNQYLPIGESLIVVIFLIGFTMTYKMLKIVLNIAHVDLSK